MIQAVLHEKDVIIRINRPLPESRLPEAGHGLLKVSLLPAGRSLQQAANGGVHSGVFHRMGNAGNRLLQWRPISEFREQTLELRTLVPV